MAQFLAAVGEQGKAQVSNLNKAVSTNLDD
jgi:hypothetical protein